MASWLFGGRLFEAFKHFSEPSHLLISSHVRHLPQKNTPTFETRLPIVRFYEIYFSDIFRPFQRKFCGRRDSRESGRYWVWENAKSAFCPSKFAWPEWCNPQRESAEEKHVPDPFDRIFSIFWLLSVSKFRQSA